MENKPINSPKVFLEERQNKDKHFSCQKQEVFAAFSKQPKTMFMVEKEIGISRANICRYVAALREENNIWLIEKTICAISKHRAGYYTSDKNLFTKTSTNLPQNEA